MKQSPKSQKFMEALLGLSEESVALRNRWRTIALGALWFVLSLFTIILTIYDVKGTNRLIIIFMGLVKYLPIIAVTYALAKSVSAEYLQDIYELKDKNVALDFLEEIAFGSGIETINVRDGKVSEQNEKSTILMIGGPGKVKVNLNSAVLFEKVDGSAEILHPHKDPWEIGRFERIREVDENQYAIIDLNDQINYLSVKARTKDGIPLEVNDIKIIFRVLLRQTRLKDKTDPAAASYEPDAIKALVYKQMMITPSRRGRDAAAFPWESTIIHLVKTELEDIIKKNTLADLLTAIGQKELEQTMSMQADIDNIRNQISGKHKAINREITKNIPPLKPTSNFQSRSMITSRFHSPEFQKKAADLGVTLQWIDIGTWTPPVALISEKLKDAWKQIGSNANKRAALERRQGRTHEEFLKIVEHLVIDLYEDRYETRLQSSKKHGEKEADIILESLPFSLSSSDHIIEELKDPIAVAHRILDAIRRELLGGKELISPEDTATHQAINNAIQDINRLIPIMPHWINKK